MSARILVVDDVPANVKLLEARLSAEYFDVMTASNGAEALEICSRAECDIILLDVMMPDMDGFEVCRRLKSNPATHFIPVVIVTALDSPADRVRGLDAGADDFLTKPVSDVVLIARVRSLTRLKMMTDEFRMRAITSLEIGVNDYLLRPVDKNELLARARTQIRRRRNTDHLRDNVQNSIEMAITDALTGLHNRRYMESHLATLAEQASSRGKPLALMILDIDFFKAINDNYGHDAGDDVLREFAVRIRKSIRGIDLACRYGGEEFVIVMPETDLHVAGMVAERLRRSIAGETFAVNKATKRIEVTISIGLTTLERKGEAVGDVLKRADTALYRAKHDGRNRVVATAA